MEREKFLSFGSFFKEKRIELGKSLRKFCAEHELDPGNISKIERDRMAPPLGRIDQFARHLRLDGEDLQTFKDLAAISAGRIPKDLTEEETLARLPIFFRAARDSNVSTEKLKELVEAIKKS